MNEATSGSSEERVRRAEAWLRSRTLAELLPREELEALRDELRADDDFWARARPRFEKVWARVEERLRSEDRAAKDVLAPATAGRLLDAAEAFEPDPEAIKTFLRSPAVESTLGDVLYHGISEFIRRADLLGRVVDKLPVLGGIRRRFVTTFKEEIESRLEGQVKTFLGTFSGMAVERLIERVLSEENRPEFAKAQRRVAEHLLERPVRTLLPDAATTARWRDAVWEALRKPPVEDEDELLERLYADFGDERLEEWTWALTDRTRALLARRLDELEAAG